MRRVVLCCAMLCCVVLCHVVVCGGAAYGAVPLDSVLWCVVSCCVSW